MKKNDEIREELKELSPFLAKMKREDAFKVPKNYFDSLPDKVLEQVQPQPATQQTPQISWFDRLIDSFAVLLQPRYAVGLATVAVLLVAGVFYMQKPVAPEITPDNSLAQYISDNIDEFDAEMIYELSIADRTSGENIPDNSTTDPTDIYIDEIIDGLDDSDLEKLL